MLGNVDWPSPFQPTLKRPAQLLLSCRFPVAANVVTPISQLPAALIAALLQASLTARHSGLLAAASPLPATLSPALSASTLAPTGSLLLPTLSACGLLAPAALLRAAAAGGSVCSTPSL